MFLIRPITSADLDAYEQLAHAATLGITNLPAVRPLLSKKIANSLEAFSKEVIEPNNENYVFVLEDTDTGNLGGTCAIFSKTGVNAPIYAYRVETTPTTKILHPVAQIDGPSEIGGLFLLPECRKEGLGRLLSFSRFLFIATFPHRFTATVISEMRGIIRKNDTSPFWNGLGRHFYPVSFREIIAIFEKNPQKIDKVLSKYPIYATFLSPEARLAMGKTHPQTTPALRMLEKEGFRISKFIDALDGGPKIQARTQTIRVIRQSKTGSLAKICEVPPKSKRYLICNQKIDFRVCYAQLQHKRSGEISLTSEVAAALQISIGDQVRYVTPYSQRKSMDKSL